MTEDEVATEIGRQAADEIGAVLRAARVPALGRFAINLLARSPSARLGRLLARFDSRIGDIGIARAAGEVLAQLGATIDVDGACPSSGGVLVVVNHPGAYDALAMMAALGRDDVALIASDRTFLRAMPRLAEHLVFLLADEEGNSNAKRRRQQATARVRGLRRALHWLERGKVLVQFGAGAIEPDARFSRTTAAAKVMWSKGTGWLAERAARIDAAVVPCFVSGVHSPRAKRLSIVRWTEHRGITTIAPLIQATLPGFRDVAVSVRIGSPIDRTALVRAASNVERASMARSASAALFEMR